MKKKMLFLTALGAIFATSAATIIVSRNHATNGFVAKADDTYTITLDSSNTPSSLTSSYQNSVAGEVPATSGYMLSFQFSNAKTASGKFAQLAPHGTMYNFATGSKEVKGLRSVSFTGTGSLFIATAKAGQPGGAYLNDKIAIPNNGTPVDVIVSNYFQFVAGDDGAIIESLSLTYTCKADEYSFDNLIGKYTGIGNDGFTYLLDVVSDSDITIKTLDKAANIEMHGSGVMLNATQAKCTYELYGHEIYYTVSVSADKHSLTYVSKSDDAGGAYADNIAEVNFDRVYNVEDFQSYSASGQGYTNSTTKYQTSGLRANYYADYYTGSSSGEIGGNGWPVMTSTDNTTFNSQKGHNSSKTGIFKFSNGMGMRYITMNELYGVPSVIGKGSTLSFWARGAYTNTNFNTNHASEISMKVYAFYAAQLTPSTQTSVREEFAFTVNSGSTWQHFEMPLTEGRAYFGFGIYAKQSSGSTMYVPFDDFEIYTASPYAEYVAPVAVTGVSVSPTVLELITGSSSQLTATVSPNDATNKNVAWSSNNTNVATVDADGTVHAVASGNATITATTADGGFTANCAVTVSVPATVYPEGTFKGTAVVSSADFDIVIAFGNQANGLIAVRLSNQDAVATGVTFNQSTKVFTITTTGDYSGGTYGDITGTYDVDNDRLINISCSGSIKSFVSNNGSITATRLDNMWNCDGTTSQLQSTFKRRYMSGSWQVDNSNADRITSNTTQFVSGTGSVKRRGYSGGAVALNFQSDFSPAKTVKNVQFWVYNPHSSDITLRMWGYKATGFGSNFETGEVVAKKGQWTYLAMGFTSAAIYNFQIADFNNTGAYLSFDNITLF